MALVKIVSPAIPAISVVDIMLGIFKFVNGADRILDDNRTISVFYDDGDCYSIGICVGGEITVDSSNCFQCLELLEHIDAAQGQLFTVHKTKRSEPQDRAEEQEVSTTNSVFMFMSE